MWAKLTRKLLAAGKGATGEEVAPALPRTAEGERVYAIGDVHGRFDLLMDLMEQIGRREAHLSSLPGATPARMVFLGDLIDRGAQSDRVIEYLYTAGRDNDHLTVLMGNHEELMVRALEGDFEVYQAWMRWGGAETVRSFGVAPLAGDDYDAQARQFAARVPPEWAMWLAGLPSYTVSGDYFFCHAGVRPSIPLHSQSASDLLWIRGEFLKDDSDHGAVIVHGHTIVEQVERYHNRIAIDTGAYRTGILTAVYLDEDRCEIIATGSAS